MTKKIRVTQKQPDENSDKQNNDMNQKQKKEQEKQDKSSQQKNEQGSKEKRKQQIGKNKNPPVPQPMLKAAGSKNYLLLWNMHSMNEKKKMLSLIKR